MTPEQVRELADKVQETMAPGRRYGHGHDALDALIDELLRHLGAPRVPVKISKARLAEIEAKAQRHPEAEQPVDCRTLVFSTDNGQTWWRRHLQLDWDGVWRWSRCQTYPTLRAALEAPVVRRAGEPPVIEFEVES